MPKRKSRKPRLPEHFPVYSAKDPAKAWVKPAWWWMWFLVLVTLLSFSKDGYFSGENGGDITNYFVITLVTLGILAKSVYEAALIGETNVSVAGVSRKNFIGNYHLAWQEISHIEINDAGLLRFFSQDRYITYPSLNKLPVEMKKMVNEQLAQHQIAIKREGQFSTLQCTVPKAKRKEISQ